MKKDFKQVNPALQYITQAEPESKPENRRQSLEPETKSKRLNLLLYPSLLEDLKKIATMQRRSVNDLINEILSVYTEEQLKTIEKFNQVFNEEA